LKRRLILLMAVATALLALPAVASAGCAADAGGTAYTTNVDGNNHAGYAAAGAIQCTTNNGDWYELRLYYAVSRDGGSTYAIATNVTRFGYGPGDPLPTNYNSTHHLGWLCTEINNGLVAEFDHVRLKVVVENMRTHTTDVENGTARISVGGCDGI